MRTFRHDDELIARGANPRTGLVTPFTPTDGGVKDKGRDYLSRGYASSPLSGAERRKSSGHWRANDSSWSFVEPTSSPAMPVLNENGSVPPKNVTGSPRRNIADSLGGSGKSFASEKQHEGRGRLIEHDQAGAMSSSPFQQGADSRMLGEQSNGLQKIPRKQVGSHSPVRKELAPRASPPSFTFPEAGMPKEGSSSVISDSSISDAIGRSILGKDGQDPFIQKARHDSDREVAGESGIKKVSLHFDRARSPVRPMPVLQQQEPLPALSHILPQLQFRHPSDFNPMSRSGQRQPGKRMPPSLRSGSQKRQALEQAANMSPIGVVASKIQRPKIERQHCQQIIPCRPLQQGTLNQPIAAGGQSPAQRPPAGHNSIGRSLVIQKPALESEHDPIGQVDRSAQEKIQTATRSIIPKAKVMDPTKVIQERTADRVVTQDSHSLQLSGSKPCGTSDRQSQVICSVVPAYVLSESNNMGVGDGSTRQELRTQELVPKCNNGKGQNAAPPSTGITAVHTKRTSIRPLAPKANSLKRRPSIFARAQDLNLMFQALENGWPVETARFVTIRTLLYVLANHVITTMIHGLAAIRTLRNPEARISNYAIALRDICLGTLYLLITLHVLMMVQKLLELISKLLYYTWHPLDTLIVVMRWLVVP